MYSCEGGFAHIKSREIGVTLNWNHNHTHRLHRRQNRGGTGVLCTKFLLGGSAPTKIAQYLSMYVSTQGHSNILYSAASEGARACALALTILDVCACSQLPLQLWLGSAAYGLTGDSGRNPVYYTCTQPRCGSFKGHRVHPCVCTRCGCWLHVSLAYVILYWAYIIHISKM